MVGKNKEKIYLCQNCINVVKRLRPSFDFLFFSLAFNMLKYESIKPNSNESLSKLDENMNWSKLTHILSTCSLNLRASFWRVHSAMGIKWIQNYLFLDDFSSSQTSFDPSYSHKELQGIMGFCGWEQMHLGLMKEMQWMNHHIRSCCNLHLGSRFL